MSGSDGCHSPLCVQVKEKYEGRLGAYKGLNSSGALCVSDNTAVDIL